MSDRQRISLGIARRSLLAIELDYECAEWSAISLPAASAKQIDDRVLALGVTTGIDEVEKYLGQKPRACVYVQSAKSFRELQKIAGTVPTNASMLLDVIRVDKQAKEYVFVLLEETYRMLRRYLSSINAPIVSALTVENILNLDAVAPFAVVSIVSASFRVTTTPNTGDA